MDRLTIAMAEKIGSSRRRRRVMYGFVLEFRDYCRCVDDSRLGPNMASGHKTTSLVVVNLSFRTRGGQDGRNKDGCKCGCGCGCR